MVSASKDGAVYLLQCFHHVLGHLLKVKETHHVLCYTEDSKKFRTWFQKEEEDYGKFLCVFF